MRTASERCGQPAALRDRTLRVQLRCEFGTADPAIGAILAARDIGVATSSATLFRSMGGSLGTAVFLSMVPSYLRALTGNHWLEH